MLRAPGSNHMITPLTLTVVALSQYSVWSSQRGQPCWQWPHFQLASQRHPNPLDEGRYNLVRVCSEIRGRQECSFERDPYGYGQKGRETFLAHSIWVRHYLLTLQKLCFPAIFFANGPRIL